MVSTMSHRFCRVNVFSSIAGSGFDGKILLPRFSNPSKCRVVVETLAALIAQRYFFLLKIN